MMRATHACVFLVIGLLASSLAAQDMGLWPDLYIANAEAGAGARKAENTQPSPSDRPLPKPDQSAQPAQPPVVADATDEGAECPCATSHCDACACQPAQPWQLPQPCCLQSHGIKVGGWIQQGLTFNPDGPASGFNGPLTTNDFSNSYQLNQAWVYFVRPTKTDGCGWDIGGRVDVVYGTDWRFGYCEGLENRINGANNSYGLILPQFYLEFAVNYLTVKLGHFATMTSYEKIPAPMNFFYSHCYLMAGYFDPLLATGLQAEYALGDNWTLVGGFNRGWEMFEDPNSDLNFLGGVRWVSDDKRANLSAMVDTGPQQGFLGNNPRDSVIITCGYNVNECLTYGAQYTVGREQNGSFVTGGATDANWYGTDQYLFYKLNCKWSVGFRYELVRDEDGSRIAGIGGRPATTYGWDGLAGVPGYAGTFQDLSLGVNWHPHPNFVLRPEVRWDWYGGSPNAANQLPFDDGAKGSQFTTAVDLVVTF